MRDVVLHVNDLPDGWNYPDKIESEVVSNVVFLTSIDQRSDISLPDRFDIYYRMADNRIGVARLELPNFIPQGGVVDPLEAKV